MGQLEGLRIRTLKDIRDLIMNQVPESTFLEYKAGMALSKTDEMKKEISKDVSAFANGGGGVLIYGIEELEHKPVALVGVDQRKVNREWLEQVIYSSIHRKIEGIEIVIIDTEQDDLAIYVLEIPQSERAPHQAVDKRFYIRRNYSVEMMEEYEIRDVLNRKRAPKIMLEFFLRRLGAHLDGFHLGWTNPEVLQQVEMNARIWNEGGGEVERVAITLLLDSRIESGDVGFTHKTRRLLTTIDGREITVCRIEIPWRAPDGLSLFRSMIYRLFENDYPIKFMEEWIESPTPPFVFWEIKAPNMEPIIGFNVFKRRGDDLIIEAQEVPKFGDFRQNDRNRPMLTKPDLSYGPSSE